MNRNQKTSGGRYLNSAKHPKRRLRWRKDFVLLCSVLVLAAGIIGGTAAFLTTQTPAVRNTFTPAKVTCSVNEIMYNNTKSDVSIQNTGDIDAFIRAEIVVTWQNDAEEVYGKAPVLGTDYTISALHEGWFEADGYYYCKTAVAPGEATPQMFASVSQIGQNPAEGYTLCVEILADAVQAKGTDSSGRAPAEIAWNAAVGADGTISKGGAAQ